MLAVYNREVEISRVSSRSHAEDARLERPCTAGCRRVGGATPSCTRAAGVEGTDVCLAVVDMRPITPPALQETAPQSHTKRHRSSVVGRRSQTHSSDARCGYPYHYMSHQLTPFVHRSLRYPTVTHPVGCCFDTDQLLSTLPPSLR